MLFVQRFPNATALFEEALRNPIRPIDTDLIFFGEPGKDGKRRPYNFNKVWIDIKRSVGCADFRFHDLRHEAVSRFLEAGLIVPGWSKPIMAFAIAFPASDKAIKVEYEVNLLYWMQEYGPSE